LLNRLAELYKKQGKWKESEQLYKRALSIRERAVGTEHPLVAYLLNDLGVLYFDQGKQTEAEHIQQRLSHIIERTNLSLNERDNRNAAADDYYDGGSDSDDDDNYYGFPTPDS